MAQESLQLRQRVADLTATNGVLVASIPNLSQRYKCAAPPVTLPLPACAFTATCQRAGRLHAQHQRARFKGDAPCATMLLPV